MSTITTATYAVSKRVRGRAVPLPLCCNGDAGVIRNWGKGEVISCRVRLLATIIGPTRI